MSGLNGEGVSHAKVELSIANSSGAIARKHLGVAPAPSASAIGLSCVSSHFDFTFHGNVVALLNMDMQSVRNCHRTFPSHWQ